MDGDSPLGMVIGVGGFFCPEHIKAWGMPNKTTRALTKKKSKRQLFLDSKRPIKIPSKEWIDLKKASKPQRAQRTCTSHQQHLGIYILKS